MNIDLDHKSEAVIFAGDTTPEALNIRDAKGREWDKVTVVTLLSASYLARYVSATRATKCIVVECNPRTLCVAQLLAM